MLSDLSVNISKKVLSLSVITIIFSVTIGVLFARSTDFLYVVVGGLALVALWLIVSRNLATGILLIFLIAPFNDLQRLPQFPQVNLVRIIGLVTFTVWLYNTSLRRSAIKLYRVGQLLVALLAVLFLSSINAAYPASSFSNWLTLFSYCLISVVVFNEVNSARDITRILYAYVIAAGIVGLIAIVQFETGQTLFPQLLETETLSASGLVTEQFVGRTLGTAANPNTGALVPVIGIPLVLSLLLFKKQRRWHLFLFILLAAMLAHLVLSFSRSAWIAVTLSSIVLLSFAKKKDLPRFIPYAVLSTILLILFILSFEQISNAVESRLLQAVTLDHEDAGRLALLSAAAPFLRDNWLLGVGLGAINFQTEMAAYIGVPLTAHNNLLAIGGGGGLVALLLYTLVFIQALQMSIRARRYNLSHQRYYLNAGLISSIVSWQIHGLFHSYYSWVVGWLLLALLIVNVESAESARG